MKLQNPEGRQRRRSRNKREPWSLNSKIPALLTKKWKGQANQSWGRQACAILWTYKQKYMVRILFCCRRKIGKRFIAFPSLYKSHTLANESILHGMAYGWHCCHSKQIFLIHTAITPQYIIRCLFRFLFFPQFVKLFFFFMLLSYSIDCLFFYNLIDCINFSLIALIYYFINIQLSIQLLLFINPVEGPFLSGVVLKFH